MITLKSHGHKFSQPECNFKFDVSFFANPWRDKKIREEKDTEKRKRMVMKFMEEQDGVESFVERTASLLRSVHTFFPDENIQVAICCSAGEYRSPAIVEMIAEQMKRSPVTVIHSPNSKI